MAQSHSHSDGEDDASRAAQQAQKQGRAAQWFPLSTKEGFSQWWTGASPMATEHRVLSFIPHLQQPPTQTQTGSGRCSKSTTDLSAPPETSEAHTTTDALTDPYGPRRWNSEIVELSGKGRALNEFSVERVGEEVEDTLVMLHGYGAGLGFYYRNFEALSRSAGWKVYALDLLGMGRSSRPSFKIHAKDREGKITEAENWFIDALEEWRIKRGIERFTLLGHSLGGYLATAYALKYPGRLNKLILASPVGIPEDPHAVNDDIPDPEDSTMANEFTQDQDETTDTPSNHRLAPTTAAKKDPPRRRVPPWLAYLWESNMISPFSLIRWSGPLGPRLVSGWTSRRFSQLPEEEAQALHDYSYSIFRQRGSSEYALAYLLAPGAFARSPLIRRIHGVGRQWIQPHDGAIVDGDAKPSSNDVKREPGLPVVFMYGEHDWMDVAGGFAAQEVMRKEKERLLEGKSIEEKKKDHSEAKVVIINKAGHHVYLDGWEQFNEVMAKEMADVRAKRLA
ncbi:unnamed protein product [Periconia digitata]|uniref:AB hydrolase-1 domain-containing protein n=1 Tax=Periconia digitata TaxID=1303443 RepID=A0A9W4XFZ0_9PLEO|nr:unnamed protein product [Periconia digitata]